MSIIRLEKVLKSGEDSRLRHIVRTAEDMCGLTTRLRACLDDSTAPHLLSANLRDDGELVLVCSSSAWASRLRFESEKLLAAARAGGGQAQQCKVRVASELTQQSD